MCVCVGWINRGILSVGQDNVGSDSKPLLLWTFCLACSLASLLSLYAICSAGMKGLCSTYVYLNMLMYACCVMSVFVIFVCVWHRQSSREWRVSWSGESQSKKMCCSYLSFHFSVREKQRTNLSHCYTWHNTVKARTVVMKTRAK